MFKKKLNLLAWRDYALGLVNQLQNLCLPWLNYALSDGDLRKCFKVLDLKACTWNVRSLNGEGAAAKLVDVLAMSLVLI